MENNDNNHNGRSRIGNNENVNTNSMINIEMNENSSPQSNINIPELQNQINNQNVSINQLNSNINKLNKELEQQLLTNKEQESTNIHLNNALSQQRKINKVQKNTINKLQSTISKQSNTIFQQKIEIDELNTTVIQQNKRINAQNKRINAQNIMIGELNFKLDKQNIKIRELSYKVDEQNIIINKLNNKFLEYESQLKELKQLENKKLNQNMNAMLNPIKLGGEVQLATVMKYYLEFHLIPNINKKYNTNYTIDSFKVNEIKEFIIENDIKNRIYDIIALSRKRNQDVHVKDRDTIIHYINDVKSVYNYCKDSKIQIDQIKNTVLSIFREITDDNEFILTNK